MSGGASPFAFDYDANTIAFDPMQREYVYEAKNPHPDYPCRHDGRCQYAIDHGAEGMGHCPIGKCVMAAT